MFGLGGGRERGWGGKFYYRIDRHLTHISRSYDFKSSRFNLQMPACPPRKEGRGRGRKGVKSRNKEISAL